MLRSGGDFVQIANGSNGTLNNTITLNNSSGSNLYRVHVRVLSNHTVTTTGSFTYSRQIFHWHSTDVAAENHLSVHYYPRTTTPTIRVNDFESRTVTVNGVVRTFNLTLLENIARPSANDWNSTSDPVPVEFVNGLGGGTSIMIRAGTPAWINTRYPREEDMLTGGINSTVPNGWVRYGTTTETIVRQINNRNRSIQRATLEPNFIYLVNKQQAGNITVGGVRYTWSERSAIGHQNTMNHEIGHALGFRGHSIGSAAVLMSNTETSNINLVRVSIQERDHINQFRRVYY